MILGEWIPQISHDYIPDKQFQQYNIWITLTVENRNNMSTSSTMNAKRRPKLHSMFSCGYLYRTSCYMVEYAPIRSDEMQYLELRSLIDNSMKNTNIGPTSELNEVISQINTSYDLYLYCCQVLPSQPSLIKSSQTSTRFLHTFLYTLSIIAYFHYILSLIIVFISNNKITIYNSYEKSLSDLSLFYYYLSEKFSEISLALQWCTILSTSWSKPPKLRHIIWCRLRGYLLYSLIDLILGCICGYIIWCNTDNIINYLLYKTKQMELTYFLKNLHFLYTNASGITLNPLVTKHFNESITLFIKIIRIILTKISILNIFFMKMLACIGTLGFTIQCALVIDFLRICTLHLYAMYTVISVIHLVQVNVLYSLWYLFYGLKYNVLRNRVDTYHYDRRQLLLGTALFAILVFLFPSFTAYFLLFIAIRLSILSLEVFLWLIIVSIRHFPLYKLWLSIVSPSLLSNGIAYSFDTSCVLSSSHPVTPVDPCSSVSTSSQPAKEVLSLDSFPQASSSSYLSRPLKLQSAMSSFSKGDHRSKLGRGMFNSLSSSGLASSSEQQQHFESDRSELSTCRASPIRTELSLSIDEEPESPNTSPVEDSIETHSIPDSVYSIQETYGLLTSWTSLSSSSQKRSAGPTNKPRVNTPRKSKKNNTTISSSLSFSTFTSSSIVLTHLKMYSKKKSLLDLLNFNSFLSYVTRVDTNRVVRHALSGLYSLHLDLIRNMFPRLEIGSTDTEVSQIEIELIEAEGEYVAKGFWADTKIIFGNKTCPYVPPSIQKQLRVNRAMLFSLLLVHCLCFLALLYGLYVFIAEYHADITEFFMPSIDSNDSRDDSASVLAVSRYLSSIPQTSSSWLLACVHYVSII